MIQPLEMVARAFATHVADSLLEGTVIALIAWAALYLLRQRGAALRFTILMAAMLTTVSLPLLRAMSGSHVGRSAAVSVPLSGFWAVALLAIWAAGASIGILRLLWGYFRIRAMRKSCRPAEDTRALALFAEIAAQSCPRRKPVLLISDDLQLPCAIGFAKAAVLLPAAMADELPAEDLRHVLVHELAHLRRWDDWSNLLQRVVRALLFFHPAMWWVDSRMSLEREMACDDAVMAVAPAGRSYAACLVRLAEYRLLRKGFALAQAAVGHVRQLRARVNRLVAIDGRCPAPLRRGAIALGSAATVAVVGALLQTPVLVSFHASEPVRMAAAAHARPFIKHGAPQVVNAAWSQPGETAAAKAPVQKTNAVTRAKSTLAKTYVQPRLRQASFASSGYQEFVVVVAGPEGFAVWHVTTWQVPATQRQPVGRRT